MGKEQLTLSIISETVFWNLTIFRDSVIGILWEIVFNFWFPCQDLFCQHILLVQEQDDRNGPQPPRENKNARWFHNAGVWKHRHNHAARLKGKLRGCSSVAGACPVPGPAFTPTLSSASPAKKKKKKGVWGEWANTGIFRKWTHYHLIHHYLHSLYHQWQSPTPPPNAAVHSFLDELLWGRTHLLVIKQRSRLVMNTLGLFWYNFGV